MCSTGHQSVLLNYATKALSGIFLEGVENPYIPVTGLGTLPVLEGAGPGGATAGCEEKHKASLVESPYLIILIQGLHSAMAPLLYQILIRVLSSFGGGYHLIFSNLK